ncbi:MAG TPA: formate dehydrogenase subunit alpha [Nitrospiraceae bacterium]|nr:formate dehydrogenase subunit alpha [Nitrospiraceae bacterium]
MASLATIFGSGAMTNSIREIEGMEVIFIIGSNTKETHPVIANRMIKAHRKGARIIVADPRRVPMVKFAELFLRIRPGSDIALLNGMAHVIVQEGLQNDEFIREKTEGFEAWKRSLREFTPEVAEGISGVPKEQIIQAARIYGGSRKAGIFYTMGITQHACGTDNVRAIANLATLTGNIGREFTGVNPLRGQNNVQGASDAACLPNVYPGYQKVDDKEIRQKFEKAWGVPLSPKPGLTATEMMNAALDGSLKALYIMGENPVITDPNMHHTIKALNSLEFLVVQDIFMTETAHLADVILPAACSFEKDGTFTNTERRVQRVRKVVNPPPRARDDLTVIKHFSRSMGCPMEYDSPEQVLQEFGRLWPAMAGITYGRLEKNGIAWPCPSPDHPGTEFLYQDGFPKGKVPFVPVPFTPPAETTSDEYPFVLTTGRNLFQYHSGSMTRRVKPIEQHAGEAYVELNAMDGKKLGIKNGERIKVRSRRGQVEIKARISRRVAEGIVFIPMHYREAAANVITNDALDPTVKIPEFKVCAVAVERIVSEADEQKNAEG